MSKKQYPMTYEEFENRLFELFIERGNKKEDWHYFTDPQSYLKSDETLIDSWYEQFCYLLDKFDDNHFHDENLEERISRIELDIKIDNTKYPMTYEEYEKRLIELLLKDTTSDEKKQLLEYLNDLLEEDPHFIKGLYHSDCAYYAEHNLKGMGVFEDSVLLAIPVNTLEMSL